MDTLKTRGGHQQNSCLTYMLFKKVLFTFRELWEQYAALH